MQHKLLALLGWLGLIAISAIIVAFPVKWIWNWLVPQIFGLPEISALQALGLVALTSLLSPGRGSGRGSKD